MRTNAYVELARRPTGAAEILQRPTVTRKGLEMVMLASYTKGCQTIREAMSGFETHIYDTERMVSGAKCMDLSGRQAGAPQKIYE